MTRKAIRVTPAKLPTTEPTTTGVGGGSLESSFEAPKASSPAELPVPEAVPVPVIVPEPGPPYTAPVPVALAENIVVVNTLP